MKMKDARKGQMRIIETLLASFVIVAALAFMNTMAMNPPSSRYETSDLEKLGYNVLHNLNEQGVLVRYVYDREWNNLEAALRVSLPTDVYFNLTVIDREGYVEGSIIYGGTNVFASSSTGSVVYVLSGSDDYDPRILVLELVRR
jgi:hypothetical protein